MANALEAIPAMFLIIAAFPLFAMAFLKIVGMMIENEIDSLPGIIALGILFTLYGTMCITKDPWIPWAVMLVIATSMAFYPFAAKQVTHLDMRRINRSGIEKSYEAWAARPDNAPAALALAKGLYDHGFRAAGIAIAEATISRFSTDLDMVTLRAPRDMFRQEDILLQRWKRDFKPDETRALKCGNCGNMNDPTALQCAKCKRPYILETLRGGDSMTKLAGKLVLGFALVGGNIVLMVALALMFKGSMQSVAIFAGVAVTGLILAWMFRQPKYDGTMYRPMVSED